MRNKIIIIIAVLVVGGAEFAFGAWMYQTAAVDKMRAAAVEELHSLAVLDEYGPSQQKKIRKIMDKQEPLLLAAEEEHETYLILQKARKKIKKIPTLEEIRDEGVEDLNASVDLDKYREKQQKQIKEILKSKKKKIRKCTSKKQIKKIIADTGDQIKGIKTNAQLTAEEEAERQRELERQRAAAAAAAAAEAKAKAEKEKKEKKESKKKKD